MPAHNKEEAEKFQPEAALGHLVRSELAGGGEFRCVSEILFAK